MSVILSELGFIVRALGSRWLWGLMVVALLGIGVAYQVKRPILVDIGGPHDCPYLGTSEYCPQTPNWHDPESNRWTKVHSDFFLPGIGSQPLNVTLRVLGGRPGNDPPPPEITVRINGQEHKWQTEQGFAEKTFFVPNNSRTDSSIHLTILSPVFSTPTDKRELGVNIDWIRVEPADYSLLAPAVPSISVSLYLLASLFIVYAMAYRVFLSAAAATAIAGSCLLVALGVLAVRRPEITMFAPHLAVVLLWSWLFALFVLVVADANRGNMGPGLLHSRDVEGTLPHQPCQSERSEESRPSLISSGKARAQRQADTRGTRFFAALRLTRGRGFASVGHKSEVATALEGGHLRPANLVAGIFAVAFVLRFGGMVYPQFISSDLTFHAHRIDFVLSFFRGEESNFFFEGELPNGLKVPYPSAYYVLLSPVEWLLGGTTEAGRLVLRFVSALMDAVVVLLVYRLALRLGVVAALLAASLYAVGPAVFQLFSAGNHSNIFAQTMFVASLAVAVELLSRERGGAGKYRLLMGYCALTTLTLLGHYGMAIAAVGVTVAIGVVWLIFAPKSIRGRIVPMLGAFAAAILMSYLLYYMHYNAQMEGQFSSLLSGGSRGGGRSYDILRLAGDVVKWEGWVILPAALGGIGLLFSGRSKRQGVINHAPTALVLSGWLLACVPLAATALFDRDTIRYNFLALPALCVCAGVALQWLCSLSGRIAVGKMQVQLGMVAAAGLLGLAAVYTLATWGNLIFNQYH
ncbi:MAG TPA: hypothetical protein VGE45_15370 [Chloroflexia bacterium]